MQLTIENRLIEFVQSATCDNAIDGQTDLLLHNWLDSLLLMDLVILIEQEAGVRLSGEEISPQHFRTLQTLAELVQCRRELEGFPESPIA